MVARFEANGEIEGFIRWDYPSSPPLEEVVVKKEDEGGKDKEGKNDGDGKKKKKKLEEGDITEIEGCRREYVERYARLASEAKERSGFMEGRCWREYLYLLSFPPRLDIIYLLIGMQI